MLTKKRQTVRANYVVLSMQNAHPYFEWNRLLSYRRIFSRNQMEKRQENEAIRVSQERYVAGNSISYTR